MELDLKQRLDNQDNKLEEIFRSVDRMRKYFLWTLIVTVATIVIPLVALVLVIPWFIKTLMSAYGSLL